MTANDFRSYTVTRKTLRTAQVLRVWVCRLVIVELRLLRWQCRRSDYENAWWYKTGSVWESYST